MTVLQTAGLSHSEIRGSKVICTYPRLIAAYHVLHRLQEPRHPPYALSYLLYACRKNPAAYKLKVHLNCTSIRFYLLYFTICLI